MKTTSGFSLGFVLLTLLFEVFLALLHVLGCFRLGGAGQTIKDDDPLLKL
jgi:hypothetical protein